VIATVLPCDAEQLDSALNNPVKDYEDMLQYQCALAAGCDVIVTNNKRDFYEFCQLPPSYLRRISVASRVLRIANNPHLHSVSNQGAVFL
jgi:hypothetical protein